MAFNLSVIDCHNPNHEDQAPMFRFIILDAPTPSTLTQYVRELQKNKVNDLVRVCGPTYKSEFVEKAGIKVHGFPFEDGAPPPPNVVASWLNLLDFATKTRNFTTIAVHCVAGLGRAPMLVALALVEYGGLEPLDAVGAVRAKRRGAINQVQLNWLTRYKTRSQQKNNGCSIM